MYKYRDFKHKIQYYRNTTNSAQFSQQDFMAILIKKLAILENQQISFHLNFEFKFKNKD